jgi:multidrug efflux pump subunit AcrB
VPSGILRVVFFPSVPSDLININLDMPQGTAWQTTHEYALRIQDAAWAMNERFREQDSQGRDVIETMLVVSDSDTSARVQMELIVSEERDIDSEILGQWLREALGPLRACVPSGSTPRPVPAARRSTCSCAVATSISCARQPAS